MVAVMFWWFYSPAVEPSCPGPCTSHTSLWCFHSGCYVLIMRHVRESPNLSLLINSYTGYDLNAGESFHIRAFLSRALSCCNTFTCGSHGHYLNLHVFHYLSLIHHGGSAPTHISISEDKMDDAVHLLHHCPPPLTHTHTHTHAHSPPLSFSYNPIF